MAANDDDAALVAQANMGDADALDEIYLRHRDWVVGVALRFTGDRDEALDVLQDTFAYLLGKFPGVVLTSTLRAFLYPAIKHLCIDRRRKQRETIDVADMVERLPAPERPDLSDLQRLLAGLPESHREVVLLRFVDDMTLQDIAAALDVPLGTVKSRLHYALDVLRKQRNS